MTAPKQTPRPAAARHAGPLATAKRLSQCRECGRTFDLPLDPLARQAGAAGHSRLSDPFAVYNDRREPPTDGRRLVRLLQMSEALAEPAEAEAAARHFPQAMAAEPECAAVLERIWSMTPTV
jgi:hypothetical protein